MQRSAGAGASSSPMVEIFLPRIVWQVSVSRFLTDGHLTLWIYNYFLMIVDDARGGVASVNV